MEHRIDVVLPEKPLDDGTLGRVAAHEGEARIPIRAGEVRGSVKIEDHELLHRTFVEQPADERAPDEAATAGHEDRPWGELGLHPLSLTRPGRPR